MYSLRFIVALSCLKLLLAIEPMRRHAHSRIGVFNCDDVVHGIGIDWQGSDNVINKQFYMCNSTRLTKNNSSASPSLSLAVEICATVLPRPYHKCLGQEIIYDERIPTAGIHRPVWPTYGEYTFIPPQRWIHSLEHGAAVFLYHPCAPPTEVDRLRQIAGSCLRRHIITPYNNLTTDAPFAIVTFGCRLELRQVAGNEASIRSYLRKRAIVDGPERHVAYDGAYAFGLITRAKTVTDFFDSVVCPLTESTEFVH